MVKINIEEVPDDEDVDDGRFGADPPKRVAAIYAGNVSDPEPRPSYFGDMRPYSSQSSQGKHALDSVSEPASGEHETRTSSMSLFVKVTTSRNA